VAGSKASSGHNATVYRQTGKEYKFFRGLDFLSDRLLSGILAFFKKTSKVTIPLTVKDI
jgi:hypothetical protein